MRVIGRWYDKGLEVGIQENTRGVEKAVDKLSDKLTFDPSAMLAKMRVILTITLTGLQETIWRTDI